MSWQDLGLEYSGGYSRSDVMEFANFGGRITRVEGATVKGCGRQISQRLDSFTSRPALRGIATKYRKPYVLSTDPLLFDVLRPGCFDDSITAGTDVKFLRAHDESHEYGRTGDSTVVLIDSEIGLFFQLMLGDDAASKDFAGEIYSGDFPHMSIGIRPVVFDHVDIDGQKVRRVAKAELLELSAVRHPAIANTSVFVVDEAKATMFGRAVRSGEVAYESSGRQLIAAISKVSGAVG